MQAAVVIPTSYDHEKELNEIGLDKQSLIEICEKILAGAAQTTENDAITASGQYGYLAGVRATREELRQKGWKKTRRGNLELTSYSSKDIHLLVSSGDKHTGNPDFLPRTKNQKGSQTKQIVYQNARCPFLFPDFMNKQLQRIQHKQDKQDFGQTWFLLYHLDKENEEMRVEVSLPISFDDNELKVSGWIKRIILDSIKFDSSIFNKEPDYADIPPYDLIKKANEQ